MITILGLGPGHPDLLTREAWDVLTHASEIYLRTARHPTVAGFPAQLTVYSFDDVYEQTDSFARVYEIIAERVLELGARPEGVLYAVPGHPNVAEASVSAIRTRAAELGLPVRIIAGLSFIEPALQALAVDALPHLQVADALDLAARHHPLLQPDAPALIAQVYSAAVAADVKLTLMNQYPDEHPVTLLHAVGTDAACQEQLPLFELDRSTQIAHLTALYLPALPRASGLETFQDTIAHLRAPDGCPWDKEQDHQTLRANLLEETYEVLAALDADDPEAMREEFGDLLLQIVLHAQIALEYGEYTLAEVIEGINTKIIRRHPHVFGDVQVRGVDDVLTNWEKLKAEERAAKGQAAKPDPGVLGSIPPGLPALLQADTYQRRAGRVGFDWPDILGVKAKVLEEIEEVEASDPATLEEELGDLLFAVVNWARWLKIEPETALRSANAKFAARFGRMEAAARAAGRALSELSLADWDQYWEAAKLAD